MVQPTQCESIVYIRPHPVISKAHLPDSSIEAVVRIHVLGIRVEIVDHVRVRVALVEEPSNVFCVVESRPLNARSWVRHHYQPLRDVRKIEVELVVDESTIFVGNEMMTTDRYRYDGI